MDIYSITDSRVVYTYSLYGCMCGQFLYYIAHYWTVEEHMHIRVLVRTDGFDPLRC